jgi:hypothetical protein
VIERGPDERSWALNGPALTLELLRSGYARATLLGHQPHTLRLGMGVRHRLADLCDTPMFRPVLDNPEATPYYMFQDARIVEDAGFPARTADFISSAPGLTARCRITWNSD